MITRVVAAERIDGWKIRVAAPAADNGSRSQVERVRWCFWMWKGDHWSSNCRYVIYDGKILRAEEFCRGLIFAECEKLISTDTRLLFILQL